MWEYDHSIETDASREAVWRLYSDVSTWPEWDDAVEWVELAGPFEVGTTGTMTVRGQGTLPVRLTDVAANEGFTDETVIPHAGLLVAFRHAITRLPDGRTLVTHRVEITGPGADTVGAEIGPGITAGIPQTMASLARYAARGSVA